MYNRKNIIHPAEGIESHKKQIAENLYLHNKGTITAIEI